MSELIEAAISEDIDIKVWTLTDYDVDGMEIANVVDKIKVPRIGIDLNTIKWLQKNGYPNLTVADVEEEHYAENADERTDDEYLWSKRIELDSVHSEVVGNFKATRKRI
jgi:5S rRNA maturation endonuclease (ribonuclease M5)